MPENGHVFISYSRNDGHPYAEKLEKMLREAGFTTWRDLRNLNPDEDFTADIEIGIEEASQVVVCITPDTKRKKSFVRREIQYALAVEKPVIPLRFADIPPHVSIVNNEWVDFFKDWDAALQRICVILNSPNYSHRSTPPPDDPFRPYLQVLLKNVVNYLKRAVIRQIDLRSASAPDAVPQAANPTDMFSQMFAGIAIDDAADSEAQAVFTRFSEAFDRYDGRVLLLGEPGAGKTITLMAYTREAVTARLDDPTLPLPLFGLIATWDSRERTPLAAWLANHYRELETAAVQQEIDQGKTLLLLDGLDELGRERPVDLDQPDGETYDPRPRFIEALTPAIEAENQVLVTCRRQEYAGIGELIPLVGAVTLNPLDDTQMQEYLREHADLWSALEKDPELREVARTPLLLSLFTYAFQDLDADLQALQDLSGGELRDHIFSTYIERRYKHEAARHALPYTLDELVDKLGRLAMDNSAGYSRKGEKDRYYWPEDNVLRLTDFGHLPGTNYEQIFIDLAVQLHLLTLSEGDTFRFIHLLLRDYLAFKTLMRTFQDEDAKVRRTAAGALVKLEDRRAVEPFIMVLRDENKWVARTAAEALGKLADKRAVDVLIDTLRDTNVAAIVRIAAAKALWELADERGIEPLLKVLQDEDASVRIAVAEVLWEWGNERGIEPLLNALQHEEPDIRCGAARALGELGDESAVKSLTPLLWDTQKANSWQHARVCDVAAKALSGLGNAGFIVLLDALQDTDAVVRRTVAEVLGKLGGAHAVEALLDALQDTDAAVRRTVVWALGELSDKRAVEPLIMMLQDEDTDVCLYAIRALGELNDKRAVEPLITILQSENKWVRRDTARVLGKLNDRRSVVPLITTLQDEDAYVRHAAIEALGILRDERSVMPLVYLLSDIENAGPGGRVCDSVARTLGILSDKRAVEPLIMMLQDENKWVRRAAVIALGALKDERAIDPILAMTQDTDGDVSLIATEVLGILLGIDEF